jgi:hypothetical protein
MSKNRILCRLAGMLATGVLVYQLALVRTVRDQGRVLGRLRHGDGSESVEVVSQPYRLDKVYKSMTGPSGNQPHIRLAEGAADGDVLWLTGLESEVVDAATLDPLANEYFCHSNLTLDPSTDTPEKHNASFSPATHGDWRIFTLIPGRMSIRLPEGFGVPIRAGTGLDHFTMSLNQNPGHPDRVVRMKTTIRFRRGRDGGVMQPLFRRGVYVYQQHQQPAPTGGPVESMAEKGHQGEACAESCAASRIGATPSEFVALTDAGLQRHPGATCCVANASTEGVVPQFGQ